MTKELKESDLPRIQGTRAIAQTVNQRFGHSGDASVEAIAASFLRPVNVSRLIYVQDGDSEERVPGVMLTSGLRRVMSANPEYRPRRTRG